MTEERGPEEWMRNPRLPSADGGPDAWGRNPRLPSATDEDEDTEGTL